MKVKLDPMPALRATAASRVTARFSTLTLADIHRELVWRRKREIADAVIGGADAPAHFAEEAALRGLTPSALAALIAAKPNPAAALDARELDRQKMLLAIDASKTPAELTAITSTLGAEI